MAIWKSLLTKETLGHWKVVNSEVYVLCNSTKETIEHLFFDCDFSNTIWSKVLKAINVGRKPLPWTREVSWFCRKAAGKTLLAKARKTALAASVYTVWRARNSVIFQRKNINEEEVFEQIRELMTITYLSQDTQRGGGQRMVKNWE